MKNSVDPASTEIEFVRQLTRLLKEEQRWFAREETGPSPYLGRREMLLDLLEAAARERVNSQGDSRSAETELLSRHVLELRAVLQRSMDMVRTRMEGLDRVRERLARRQGLETLSSGYARLGRG